MLSFGNYINPENPQDFIQIPSKDSSTASFAQILNEGLHFLSLNQMNGWMVQHSPNKKSSKRWVAGL